jgi:hypothetical protein
MHSVVCLTHKAVVENGSITSIVIVHRSTENGQQEVSLVKLVPNEETGELVGLLQNEH